VTHVASLVTIRTRLTLKAGCRAGMVGIAGRESTDIGWFSSTHLCTKALWQSLSERWIISSYSAAAARKAAISMIKLAANQINSVGMIEIMPSRIGPVQRNGSFYVALIAKSLDCSCGVLFEIAENVAKRGGSAIGV
jgi:hypothetical protein